MGALTVITAPTVEPVTLAEAKAVLRVNDSNSNTLITAHIQAAREFAEEYLGLRLVSQVVELTLDRWPGTTFALGVWPIISIDSIKYDDTASPVTEQTLVANTDYYTDIVTTYGRVTTIGGWPSVAVKPNPIRIRMTAGYADSASSPQDLADNVPEAIKHGIKLYVAYLFFADDAYRVAAENALRVNRVNV